MAMWLSIMILYKWQTPWTWYFGCIQVLQTGSVFSFFFSSIQNTVFFFLPFFLLFVHTNDAFLLKWLKQSWLWKETGSLMILFFSGPCMTLVLSKADEANAGQGTIDYFRDLIGPKDVNIAKEEAPARYVLTVQVTFCHLYNYVLTKLIINNTYSFTKGNCVCILCKLMWFYYMFFIVYKHWVKSQQSSTNKLFSHKLVKKYVLNPFVWLDQFVRFFLHVHSSLHFSLFMYLWLLHWNLVQVEKKMLLKGSCEGCCCWWDVGSSLCDCVSCLTCIQNSDWYVHSLGNHSILWLNIGKLKFLIMQPEVLCTLEFV